MIFELEFTFNEIYEEAREIACKKLDLVKKEQQIIFPAQTPIDRTNVPYIPSPNTPIGPYAPSWPSYPGNTPQYGSTGDGSWRFTDHTIWCVSGTGVIGWSGNQFTTTSNTGSSSIIINNI